MLLTLLSLSAWGAMSPEAWEEANYLVRTGRVEQALARVVPALREDPSDLHAHRLYVDLLVDNLREGPAAEALYRRWAAAEPALLAPKLGLAWVLTERHNDPGPWCLEALPLLAELPADPDAQVEVLRARERAESRCGVVPGTPPGPEGSLDAQLRALPRLPAVDLQSLRPASPQRQAWVLSRRADQEGITRTIAASMEALWAAHPSTLAWADRLWREDLRGPALASARRAALRAAERALQTESRPAIWAVWSWMVEEGPAADLTLDAALRLDALDPDWRALRSQGFILEGGFMGWVPRVPTEDSDLQPLWDALRRPSAALRLESLDALEATLPAEGPVRAQLEQLRAEQLIELGRDDEAYAAARAAALALPGDLDTTNTWAYLAALRGEDLALAEAALVRALATVPLWDPRGDHWEPAPEDFRVDTARSRAYALDTLGWLRFRQGRLPEAQAAVAEALLLLPEPEPTVYLHMALLLHAQGQPELALEYLGLGYGAGEVPPNEAALDAEARALADQLFVTRRWAPGGFEAWAQTRAPAPEPEVEEDHSGHEHAEVSEWVGKPFPDQRVEIDGKKVNLNTLPGVRVIDYWATWCGPCIDSMPHLEELTRQYSPAGVTVVTVSVDRSWDEVTAFYAGAPTPPWVQAFAGPKGMSDLGINGIPTVFVLDENDVVLAHITGYGPDDRRLDQALEAAVGR